MSKVGYIDDERPCFSTWDDREYAWQSRPLKGSQVKRRKKKGKVKVDSKELEEYSLVKNKHRILDGGHRKIVLGGPKEKEAIKVFRNVKKQLSENGFRTYRSEKNVGCDQSGHKDRGKERKAKGKEGAYLQSGISFQPVRNTQ